MGKDAKILTGIGVLTVVVVIVAAFTIGNKPGPEQQQQQQQKVLGESQVKLLLRKNTHLIKGQNAKVTIVEFGDFQCPACGVAHTVTKKILSDYKGRINFAFRDFPLSVHKNGYLSALAAESAGGQGKFWEMHDILYENQEKWSDKNNALDIFADYSKQLGLNVNEFKKDVKDKKYDNIIKQDIDDANQLGIQATPTFYINGKEFPGALNYDDFKKAIEGELGKK